MNSTPTSSTTTTKVTGTVVCRKMVAAQPICATVTNVTYVRQAERRCGSCLAARNHCPTNAIRITTYPATITLLSTL